LCYIDKLIRRTKSKKNVLSSFWKRRVTVTNLTSLNVKTNGPCLWVTLFPHYQNRCH
jgi:hypothetical protein